MFGNFLRQYRQIGVSLERLLALLQGAPPEALVAHARSTCAARCPTLPHAAERAPADRLTLLDAAG